jgi:uncharacterized protein
MSEAAATAEAPPPSATPVSEGERNRLVDALRGVALLGILLINIPIFAMAEYSSEAYRNDPASVNFWVNATVHVFFEGKMRAMFGMIFGAGVLLFVLKKEKTGRSVGGLYYRRMGWLVLFGLAHAHLVLWMGDILYLYGVCGMLVYLFRNANPKYLILCVPLAAAFDFASNTLLYQYIRGHRVAYVEARAAEAEGKALSDAQTKAIAEWRELEKAMIPSREDAAENTRKMKSDYGTVAGRVRELAVIMQTLAVPVIIWDSLALMLLGVALYKWGFLTGRWSRRAYLRAMLVGYGLGLPLVAFSFHHDYLHHPNMEAAMRRMELVPVEWVKLIYPVQRILLVLAHVSALVLLYKAKVGERLWRGLEAVGQMALTNYVGQSVICTLVFYGYGLNYYAEMQLYQLYFVVLAVWAFQLVFSSWWLARFRFGPLEWLWRSLTYWKRQPLRRNLGEPGA